MTKFLVTKGSLSGLRPTFPGIGETMRRYGQLRPSLERAGVTLFAEPVISRDGSRVAWYSDLETSWRAFPDLTAAEQLRAQQLLWAQLDRLTHALDEVQPQGRADLQRTIEYAIEVPDARSILVGQDRVILVQWGFVRDFADATTGLVRRLARPGPPSPSPAAAPPPVPPPLRVRVVAADTGQPVVGCAVQARDSAAAAVLVAGVSDAEGLLDLGSVAISATVLLQCDGVAGRYAGASLLVPAQGRPAIVELTLGPLPQAASKPRVFWLWALLLLLLLLLAAWWLLRPAELRVAVLDAGDDQPIAAGRLQTGAGTRLADVVQGGLQLRGAGQVYDGHVVAAGYLPEPVHLVCCDPHAPILLKRAPAPPAPPASAASAPMAEGSFLVRVVDKATGAEVAGPGSVTVSAPDLASERRVELARGQAAVGFPAAWAGQEVRLYVRAEGYADGAVRLPCCRDLTVELDRQIQPSPPVGQRGDYEITLRWKTADDLDLKLHTDPPVRCTREGTAQPPVRLVDFNIVGKLVVCEDGDTRYSTKLDVDANASTIRPDPVEHIYVNKVGAQSRPFRVQVERFRRRSEQNLRVSEVPYTIEVKDATGRVMLDMQGTARDGRPDLYEVSM